MLAGVNYLSSAGAAFPGLTQHRLTASIGGKRQKRPLPDAYFFTAPSMRQPAAMQYCHATHHFVNLHEFPLYPPCKAAAPANRDARSATSGVSQPAAAMLLPPTHAARHDPGLSNGLDVCLCSLSPKITLHSLSLERPPASVVTSWPRHWSIRGARLPAQQLFHNL